MPARAVLAQVFQLLTLVRFLDVYQRFTYVDHTNQPSPIPDEASRFASHLTAIPAIRYIVTRASHPAVTRDACRVRLPLTEERVSLLTGKKTSSLLKQLHHRLRVAHPPNLWITSSPFPPFPALTPLFFLPWHYSQKPNFPRSAPSTLHLVAISAATDTTYSIPPLQCHTLHRCRLTPAA